MRFLGFLPQEAWFSIELIHLHGNVNSPITLNQDEIRVAKKT